MITALLFVISAASWPHACDKALAEVRAAVHKAAPQVVLQPVQKGDEVLVLASEPGEETLRITVRREAGDQPWQRSSTIERKGDEQIVHSRRTRRALRTIEVEHDLRQSAVHDDKRPAFIPLDKLEATLDACALAKDPK